VTDYSRGMARSFETSVDDRAKSFLQLYDIAFVSLVFELGLFALNDRTKLLAEPFVSRRRVQRLISDDLDLSDRLTDRVLSHRAVGSLSVRRYDDTV
jgi:hypothetical protein